MSKYSYLKKGMMIFLCFPFFAIGEVPFVIGELMGQLGNQMFIIAATTSLALDNNASPHFPSLLTEERFNIPLNYKNTFYHLDVSSPNSSIDYCYVEPHFQYAAIPYQPNMRIIGWFQSEKYFRHHKQEIVNLLAPRPEIVAYLTNRYKWIIEHQKSVSIHYRSYLLEDPNHTVYADSGIEYFEKAIALFPEDSLFVVFSNDIDWCKENFCHLPCNFYFVENESHYHDLYLMSMCKDHIISNSSFSWWGAYLNPSDYKRVVVPPNWFNLSTYWRDESDLIPPEWIRLSE